MLGYATLNLEENWTLVDSTSAHSLPVTIPADVHSTLVEAGKIGDPATTLDESFAWVHQRDWKLSRTVILDDWPEDVPAYLELTRVDAIANVYWDDQQIGRCDNTFRTWRFPISATKGEHLLTIELLSSEQVAANLAETIPLVPPSPGHNRVSHMNLLRKPQCQTGWDWAPCVPVMGISGTCKLQATPIHLVTFDVHQKHQTERCELTVIVEIERLSPSSDTIQLRFADQETTRDVPASLGLHTIEASFTIDAPKLWHPVGYGDQALYPLTISLGGVTKTRNIGLRQLEVRRPVDDDGLGLTFAVNGTDIFARGANWIPADALPARQTPEAVDVLLDAAVAANFNMIRVWGGGQYEPDWFYEACSQRGLLVWQDFMFACAPYPDDKAFLDNVRQEAIEQIKRLRTFPCIAIFCGDNECLQSLEWYPKSRDNRERYLVAYDRLNRLLGEAAATHAPDRQFWPSSPCPGPEDFPARRPDSNSGDSHCWEIWHGGRPFSDYRTLRPRFCSEFGFQSLPSPEQATLFAPEEDHNVSAPAFENHQRCPRGNGLIIQTIAKNFRFPSDYSSMHFLSEVQQAMAIETAVAAWRTDRPRCGGVLYWQLNDVWPASSWSSIEHCGRWKQLHYRMRRAFAPTAVFIIPASDDQSWRISAVHDGNATAPIEAVCELRTYDGILICSKSATLTLTPGIPTTLWQPSLTDLDGHPPTSVFIHAKAQLADGRQISAGLNLRPWKICHLPSPAVQAQITEKNGNYELALASERPTFHVTCEFLGIPNTLSDNSITLIPGEIARIQVSPKTPTSLAQLRATLSVQHLAAPQPKILLSP